MEVGCLVLAGGEDAVGGVDALAVALRGFSGEVGVPLDLVSDGVGGDFDLAIVGEKGALFEVNRDSVADHSFVFADESDVS